MEDIPPSPKQKEISSSIWGRVARAFAVAAATLGAAAAVMGNYETLKNFYRSAVGEGPADLRASDSYAVEKVRDGVDGNFTLAMTFRKNYGIRLTDCQIHFITDRKFRIQQLGSGQAVEIPANSDSLRIAVEFEVKEFMVIEQLSTAWLPFPIADGELNLKAAAFLKCREAISNVVEVSISPEEPMGTVRME
ncbi:hypothetical protein HFN62_16430 [Rhizobium leguminosarum]|uniref:hypothetical protein n=1 Tax=Rhizobium leguminosarum TaxID=384 RepID=UPI001C947539|nr:hypothetical protein [Rhizobium leguminosarum]MBY5785304.1 hypothetical protein [Rhizobium leguminosarum]